MLSAVFNSADHCPLLWKWLHVTGWRKTKYFPPFYVFINNKTDHWFCIFCFWLSPSFLCVCSKPCVCWLWKTKSLYNLCGGSNWVVEGVAVWFCLFLEVFFAICCDALHPWKLLEIRRVRKHLVCFLDAVVWRKWGCSNLLWHRLPNDLSSGLEYQDYKGVLNANHFSWLCHLMSISFYRSVSLSRIYICMQVLTFWAALVQLFVQLYLKTDIEKIWV